MQENWRPVKKFPGYDVSDLGRVRSYWRHVVPFGQRGGGYAVISDVPQRYLKLSLDHKGYWFLRLQRDGKGHNIRIGPLVLETFVGERPPGMECCHGPNGKTDNSLPNVSWGTKSKNHNEDMLRDGTDARGEKHGGAKLTEKAVQRIRKNLRERLGKGLSDERVMQQIAEEEHVSKWTISDIRNKRKWSWLPEEELAA
jgi:hypothetical protein